jgi:hypothetical protein
VLRQHLVVGDARAQRVAAVVEGTSQQTIHAPRAHTSETAHLTTERAQWRDHAPAKSQLCRVLGRESELPQAQAICFRAGIAPSLRSAINDATHTTQFWPRWHAKSHMRAKSQKCAKSHTCAKSQICARSQKCTKSHVFVGQPPQERRTRTLARFQQGLPRCSARTQALL